MAFIAENSRPAPKQASTRDHELLAMDPLSRTLMLFHEDHGADKYHLENRQNVDAILELSKARMNMRENKRYGEGFTHVGYIPEIIYWGILKPLGIADDEKALIAWLNDPANSCWRTHPGRL